MAGWLAIPLLLPLICAMRSEYGTEHGHRRDWMKKLTVKLHSGANRTTLPQIPKVWSDRFEIKKKLGQGGYGAVYQMDVKCKDSWWSSPPPSFVSAKLVSDRDANASAMQKEVSRMQTHFSDYVVSTVGTPDTAETRDGRWVMMPFLNGGSLKDLISRCSDNERCYCGTRRGCECRGKVQPWACWDAVPGLSLPYILALFDEVLAGLEAIHQHGLAHMDMKPDNIMLQCSGKSCYALVIDLGTLIDENVPKCEVCGTRGFLGTEVYQEGGFHAGIPANDVYAMGVTLFQLLYMDYPSYITSWGPNLRAQQKYQPENDSRMPKNRTALDQLVVDMLNPNYTARITLPEVRQRVRRFIELQEPEQEVLDMIHKTPSDRGLTNTLPSCINTPTAAEKNSKEDDPQSGKIDMADLLAGGSAESKDEQPCTRTVWEAEGWFQCGVCNALFCQRCCGCLVMHEGSMKEKFFRAKSCVAR